MNTFKQNPLKIVLYSPITSTWSVNVIIGSVTPAVYDAIIAASKNKANDKQKKLLVTHYTAKYKENLALTGYEMYNPKYVANAGFDFDNINIDSSFITEETQTDQPDEQPMQTTNVVGKVNYVTSVEVFPDDTLWNVREKIFISMGIPIYAQHIFYYDDIYNVYTTPYKLYLDGIYDTSIIDLKSDNNISGIPIDSYLYDKRKEINVESFDQFTIMSSFVQNPVIYLVDLGEYTSGRMMDLREHIRETYMLDMLYYGFIVKFWPQQSYYIFESYIKDEKELKLKYPDIAIDKTITINKYKIEADIMNDLYSRDFSTKDINVAITSAVASMTLNLVNVNIRNLFDKLKTNSEFPSIRCVLGFKSNKYQLYKVHKTYENTVIQYPTENRYRKQGLTIAINKHKFATGDVSVQNIGSKQILKKYAVKQAKHKFIRSSSILMNEQAKYMFFHIQPNGIILMKNLWNEEEYRGFEDITNVIKKFGNKIIDEINGMSRFVINNGETISEITDYNVKYDHINVSIIWQKLLSSVDFKMLKNSLTEYINAGMVMVKGIQQSVNAYEIKLMKGIYEYTISDLNKVLKASGNEETNNTYEHLSNTTIRQKWDILFSGHSIRITHRTTSVKFEIIGISKKEFDFVYKLILQFIGKISKQVQGINIISAVNTKDSLKKLKEFDPELYNLKKHGSPIVYSRICQKITQPKVYMLDEFNKLSPAMQKKITKYWNFTLNKEAYYSCPSTKYPFISFKVGVHPKNYCLPCCKKIREKDSIMDTCLVKKTFDIATKKKSIDKYILAYGKIADTGRITDISEPAKVLLDPEDNNLRFVSKTVLQHVASGNNVGILFSIIDILEITYASFITSVIDFLEKNKNIFNVLLQGELLVVFGTLANFVSALNNLNSSELTEYSSFKNWNQLFIEIAWFKYEIITIIFDDNYSNGRMNNLIIDDKFKRHIMKYKINSNYKYILINKYGDINTPIILIDSNYMADNVPVRRIYTQSTDIFVKRIRKILNDNIKSSDNFNLMINLDLVYAFIEANKSYEISALYINLRNQCYGIRLKKQDKEFYIPVVYSTYLTGSKLKYEYISDISSLNKEALFEYVKSFNSYIKKNHHIAEDKYRYKLIEPVNEITFDNKIIGFITSDSDIYYYTSESNEYPIVELQYNPIDVNSKILKNAKTQLITEDNTTLKLPISLYKYNLYQLFIMEFMMYVSNDRDNKIRASIAEYAKLDYQMFIKKLMIDIKDFPEDYILIKNRIKILNKDQLLEFINIHQFDFDKTTLIKIRSSSYDEIIQIITDIANEITVVSDLTTITDFPNIYMPCSVSKEQYCDISGKQAKLIVNDVKSLVSILAHDLQNPIKSDYIFSGLFTDNVVEYFNMNVSPEENIYLSQLQV